VTPSFVRRFRASVRRPSKKDTSGPSSSFRAFPTESATTIARLPWRRSWGGVATRQRRNCSGWRATICLTIISAWFAVRMKRGTQRTWSALRGGTSWFRFLGWTTL